MLLKRKRKKNLIHNIYLYILDLLVQVILEIALSAAEWQSVTCKGHETVAGGDRKETEATAEEAHVALDGRPRQRLQLWLYFYFKRWQQNGKKKKKERNIKFLHGKKLLNEQPKINRILCFYFHRISGHGSPRLKIIYF